MHAATEINAFHSCPITAGVHLLAQHVGSTVTNRGVPNLSSVRQEVLCTEA